MSNMKKRLDNNGTKVLERRYLAKDENGNIIETPDQLFRRVADAVAEAERKYISDTHPTPDWEVSKWSDAFYQMMKDLDFLPNSPTLMNAGMPLGQLSACFVLPVEDSIDDIFNRIHDTAIIHKSGGGTGFSFSRIRGEGAMVSTTKGRASGPISFMNAFDASTGTIAQGGKRRGANMGMLRVDHPDIMKFITVKKDPKQLNNFNLSVAITKKFMEALAVEGDYDLIDPHTGNVVNTINSKIVWDTIVECAWENGEPGIIFIDRINETNFLKSVYGEIEATNPCGEQPLLPWEACNLGSINLANFISMNECQPCARSIDFAGLIDTVRLAVRFLDDVIDVNKYPLPEIEKMCKETRKIGLGVMGFADMLHRLHIPYDSEEGFNVAKSIMSTIQIAAHDESEKLANIRGTYPAYDLAVNSAGINTKIPKRRNALVTTIAPTGSISAIAGVSSGIEPLFSNCFYKHYMDDDYHQVINESLYEDLLHEQCLTPAVGNRIKEEGTIAHIEEIPEELRRIYVCAHDISPIAHVQMQAVFQQYTDNAISKTVNFNKDATKDDIRRAFMLAYETGCKGITVYRDGCRDTQVLTVGTVENKDKKNSTETASVEITPEICKQAIEALKSDKMFFATEKLYSDKVAFECDLRAMTDRTEVQVLSLVTDADPGSLADLIVKYLPRAAAVLHDRFNGKQSAGYDTTHVYKPETWEPIKSDGPRPRPEELIGKTKCVKINCGKLYVTVNHDDDGNLFEVFTTNGKGGGCPAQSEAVCRLASLLLRCGVSVDNIVRQLRGIKCTACMKNPDIHVLSCPDAIGRELEAEHKKEFPSHRGTDPFSVIANPFGTPNDSITVEELNRLNISNSDEEVGHQSTIRDNRNACPQCGSEMRFESGCRSCPKCGYSNCG